MTGTQRLHIYIPLCNGRRGLGACVTPPVGHFHFNFFRDSFFRKVFPSYYHFERPSPHLPRTCLLLPRISHRKRFFICSLRAVIARTDDDVSTEITPLSALPLSQRNRPLNWRNRLPPLSSLGLNPAAFSRCLRACEVHLAQRRLLPTPRPAYTTEVQMLLLSYPNASSGFVVLKYS